MNSVLFSSNSDEWETPKDLFISLDIEFDFTLDPCASEKNHKCARYYTIADDGLNHSWKGETVFCNPPYSKISQWVKKAFRENIFNNVTVVMLLPVRTDTKYFHDFIYKFAEIRFIKGRLHFSNSKNSAPFPSMIVVFRSY